MIIKTKYYSAMETGKLCGIKSRQYIIKYINEGFLMAIQTGHGKHKRFAILGDWIIDFKKRYKSGLTKKFSKKELREIIETLKSKLK